MKRYQVIEEIRRANLRMIVSRIGSAEIQQRLAISKQRLHNLIGRSATRPIGSELARRIESVAKYPIGWLDHQHPDLTNDFEDLMTLAETLPPERFAKLVEVMGAAHAAWELAQAKKSEQNKPTEINQQKGGTQSDSDKEPGNPRSAPTRLPKRTPT